MTLVTKEDLMAVYSGRKPPQRAVLATACVLVTILFISTCRYHASQPTSALRKQGESPWLSLTPEDTPRIVWLMTLPNAGTSFVMSLVQRATDRSTASNYGDSVTPKGDYSLPIHPRRKEGPYWLGLGAAKVGATPRKLPEKYVMVETCCNSTTSSYRSLQAFVDDCRTTFGRTAPDISKLQQYQYPIYLVSKAIHLIRNPFYQIVENFERDYKSSLNHKEWRENHPNNKEGLLQWCKDADSNVNAVEYIGSATTMRMIQKTICANQILEYSLWHNRAFEVVEELKLEGKVVYYEDFEDSKLENTLNAMVDFLELSPKLRMPPQRIAKDPENYFSAQERKDMKYLVKRLASEQTWEYVKDYFD